MKNELFIASIFYELRFTKSDKSYLEEQLVQIRAENKEDAKEKVRLIAQKNSGVSETLNDGYQIWKFKRINYLVPVTNEDSPSPFITRRFELDEVFDDNIKRLEYQLALAE